MDRSFMQLALDEAQKAFDAGEVPIGAVMVQDGRVIARAHNTREKSKNPLHHAEIRVIEKAARLKGDWRLNDCTLYVTLEPCPMCLGALFQARVGKLVVGCLDPKRQMKNFSSDHQINYIPSLKNFIQSESGSVKLSSNNHELEIIFGIEEDSASRLLKDFFRKKRTCGLVEKLHPLGTVQKCPDIRQRTDQPLADKRPKNHNRSPPQADEDWDCSGNAVDGHFSTVPLFLLSQFPVTC